jgi:hypothetical protein
MPRVRSRVLVAIALGIACVALTIAMILQRRPGVQATDFTYPWAAAHVLLAGHDPYVEFPKMVFPYGAVLFYPLPAAFIGLPFAPFDATIAAGLFTAIGTGLLAFALTRYD